MKHLGVLELSGAVGAIEFAHSAQKFAAASGRVVTLYDSDCKKILDGQSRDIWFCVCFSPDDTRIAAGALSGKISVFDTETGEELATLHGHEKAVLGVRFLSRNELVSGGDDGSLLVWNVDQGTAEKLSPPMSGQFKAIDLNAKNDIILTGQGGLFTLGSGVTLTAWDGDSKRPTSVVRLPGREPRACRTSSLGGQAFVAVGNVVFRVRMGAGEEVGTEAIAAVFEGHRKDVTWIHYDEDTNRLFSCAVDGTVRKWHPGTGESLECKLVEGQEDSLLLWSGAFSPSGLILVGSKDGLIQVLATDEDTEPIKTLSSMNEVAERRLRLAEVERLRQAEEEAARKKAAEEATRKKAAEEATRKKAAEEAARKKAEEEAARKKAEEERRERLIAERRSNKECTRCGKKLGLIDRIVSRVDHKYCAEQY